MKGVHLRTSGCDVSKLSLSRLLFTPTPMDGAAAWRLQDGHAVSDVIAQRPVHEVQCLFVPDCLVDLLLSGDVSSLILLARWYGSSARRADQRITRLFPDWPAQEWIRDVVATCRLAVPEASVKPLSSATLELAGQIRSWAPEAWISGSGGASGSNPVGADRAMEAARGRGVAFVTCLGWSWLWAGDSQRPWRPWQLRSWGAGTRSQQRGRGQSWPTAAGGSRRSGLGLGYQRLTVCVPL